MEKEKLVKQVFLVVLGQMILGVGVGWIIFANLGIDAFGVFHSGVSKTFNITFGMAMFYESLIVLIAIFFIDRKYINFATVSSLFLVGFTADLMEAFFTNILPTEISFIVRLAMVLIGCLILGVGLNFYVLANLGVGALDAIAEMITNKTKTQYQVVKMINDLTFLTIGWYLGGQVGIATVITAFAVGPIIQYIRNIVENPIKEWLHN